MPLSLANILEDLGMASSDAHRQQQPIDDPPAAQPEYTSVDPHVQRSLAFVNSSRALLKVQSSKEVETLASHIEHVQRDALQLQASLD